MVVVFMPSGAPALTTGLVLFRTWTQEHFYKPPFANTVDRATLFCEEESSGLSH